jgi:hypothetical protein
LLLRECPAAPRECFVLSCVCETVEPSSSLLSVFLGYCLWHFLPVLLLLSDIQLSLFVNYFITNLLFTLLISFLVLIPSYLLRDSPTGVSSCSQLSLGDFVLETADTWHVGRWGRSRRVQNNKEIPLLYHNIKMLVTLFSSFYHGATTPVDQGLLIIEDSRSHSFRHTAIGRTPLEEWSARRRDLYLTTHNTHKSHTTMTQRYSNPYSQQARAADPRIFFFLKLEMRAQGNYF